MTNKEKIKNKFYEGIVLPVDDPLEKGRYLVHIPELQFIDESKTKPGANAYNGVWCWNRLGNFSRYTDIELRDQKKSNSFGTYIPLKPGTHVVVQFKEEDYNTGMIVGLVSYDKPPNNDRDNFYLMMATDKSSWAFFDETSENFGLSFHRGRSNVWGDEEKVQISKSTGTVAEIHDDKITLFHHSGSYVYVDGNQISLRIGGSYIKIDANNINIYAPNNINIDSGSMVNVQDGIANGADPGQKSNIAQPSLDSVNRLNERDEDMHENIS